MADFYTARDTTMTPLPWPSIAPPFTCRQFVPFVISPDGHCILWIFIIVYTAREAARYFNKDRKTIAKMLKHALPPGYRRTGLPNRPSPGPYIGVIDEILSTDKAEFPNLRSCQSLPKTSA